jgi:SAM-dependent methyltransferase
LNQLLIGSGDWHWEGWTTLDASASSQADYTATVPPLPDAIKRQTWDVIMAVHFIEHLPVWKAEQLLVECHDILAPGGMLILEQPNIAYAAGVLLGQIVPPDGNPGQFDMWALYGDPSYRDELMLHRWGYTPDTLAEMVTRCGFAPEDIEIKPAMYHVPARDFRLEAVKGRN